MKELAGFGLAGAAASFTGTDLRASTALPPLAGRSQDIVELFHAKLLKRVSVTSNAVWHGKGRALSMQFVEGQANLTMSLLAYVHLCTIHFAIQDRLLGLGEGLY